MSIKTIHEKEKYIPVKLECDVLVAGGGTAGVVAALAAARNGAKTVLIEHHGSLGGAMINGATALHSFFNIFKAFPGVEKVQLVRGIPQEIVDRMVYAGGSPGHLEMGKGFNYDSFATVFDHEIFKHVIFEMMQEAGVQMLLHSHVVDAIVENNSVQGVIIESKSGREALMAKVVIDTTGDADVAYRAGAICRNMHPDKHGVSMTFGMANVNFKETVKYLEENEMLTQIVYGNKGSKEDNIVRIGFDLKKKEEFARFLESQGMWGPLSSSLHEKDLTYINCTVIRPVDAIDVNEMTRAEILLRKQINEMIKFLKVNIPGFQNAFLSWTPLQLQIRRTRIVECEYDISLEEIVNGVRFNDEIALYGFHDCAPRIVIKNGGAYGIPYRALLPKHIENLLVAGRMITSDWEAHMSTRNTVSCMAQGQAVGTAAAFCIQMNVSPRKIDINLLRENLIRGGVYLG